jgi:hypothetical protein
MAVRAFLTSYTKHFYLPASGLNQSLHPFFDELVKPFGLLDSLIQPLDR